MNRNPLRLLLTGASAAAIAFAITAPASAAPVPTLDSSNGTATLAAVESTLGAQLGSAFGNSWLDPDTGQFTVGVTDSSLFGQVKAAGAVPTLVKHSAAKLDSVVTGLNQRADGAPASVTGWHVDAMANSVVVSVLGSDPSAAAWAAKAGAGIVRVDKVAEAPRPLWNLIGGQALYLPGGRCSIGFNARTSSGIRLVITAGHCTGSSGTYSGVGGTIGSRYGSTFPGSDYGAVRVTSSAAVSTPYVSRYSSGGTVTVAGSAQAGVGASVCRSGSTTGWRCGSIQARGATVCYAQGCVYNMIRTNVCAEPGDSGGSLVTSGGSGARVQAQGMTSGGSGNCRTGGTTYFQPVGPALSAYGASLYTG